MFINIWQKNFLLKIIFNIFFSLVVVCLGGLSASANDHTKNGSSKSERNTINALLKPVDHTFEGNIIIIGAGAAGLAAANQLARNKVEYIIIEATDHYGGRVQKNTDFADFPIDLGAEWIHADKNSLNYLIGQNDKKLPQQVIPYTPLNVYELSSDGSFDKLAKKELLSHYKTNPEYKFKSATWFDYLKQNFADNVEHKIIYNSPVISVDYSGLKVKVTTKHGKVYFTDKVISTVPISVLKKNYIKFTPPFTSQKTKAINAVDFYQGFKLFMKFSKKFYPDAIFVETPAGEKTYYDVAFGKDSSDNVFGLLSTGVSTQTYYNLGSEKKIITNVLQELDKIYDGAASQYYLDEYLLKDWGRQAFTNGTWTNEYEQDMQKALNENLNNKVYFAGEAHDTLGYISTVHGAILSGYSTVNELLDDTK